MGEVSLLAMRALPLFQGLEPPLLERLAAASSVRVAKARAAIVAAYEPVTAIIVVLRGMAEVSLPAEDGRLTLIGFLMPGGLAGDAAALDRGPYGVSLAGGPHCDYLRIEVAAFVHAMRESTTFAFNVAVALSRRLRMMFRRHEWISKPSVSRKLAAFVVWLHEQRDPHMPAVRITQEQLGALVGVSRETANKHLRRWVQLGWIQQRAGAIHVMAPEQLLADVGVDD
ncbi:MAG: Crp/Fnr family transcriptional regulator [Kofleriaceae bacterium]